MGLRADKEVRAHSAYGPDPFGYKWSNDERHWTNRLTRQPGALEARADEPSMKLGYTFSDRRSSGQPQDDAEPLGTSLINLVEKQTQPSPAPEFLALPCKGRLLRVRGIEGAVYPSIGHGHFRHLPIPSSQMACFLRCTTKRAGLRWRLASIATRRARGILLRRHSFLPESRECWGFCCAMVGVYGNSLRFLFWASWSACRRRSTRLSACD